MKTRLLAASHFIIAAIVVPVLLVGLLTITGCSSIDKTELESAAITSIERVDSLSGDSFVSAHLEMQRFTELIYELRDRDSKIDWVQRIVAKAEVNPTVINPLRYNVDPARQYAMLAKAETGLYHLAALWNLVRVPFWETDRADKYLIESILVADSPDLAIEIIAMIPSDEHRVAAIEAMSAWFARQASTPVAIPSRNGISLLVELTLDIRPLSNRTFAILSAGSLLESLGYEDQAEKLASQGNIVFSGESGTPFVASTAFDEIGTTVDAGSRSNSSESDYGTEPRWTESEEATALLRACKSDSERVAVLIEMASQNLADHQRKDLALQQLDVAQMFLQFLDSESQADFIKEKLLQTARLYASAGQLESALEVLSDYRLELADTWISFTLTDIAAALTAHESRVGTSDYPVIHRFIRKQILEFGT